MFNLLNLVEGCIQYLKDWILIPTWFKKGNYGFSTKLDFFCVLHDMISMWIVRDIKVQNQREMSKKCIAYIFKPYLPTGYNVN